MEKKSRFELGHTEKIRRSIYVFLRDELELKLKSIALEEPYRRCQERGVPYPYVDASDLRPKKKEFSKESSLARPFLIMFVEDTIDAAHQKYIRFSDTNKVRKDNLSLVPDVRLHRPYSSMIRFFERDSFFELLDQLLDVDYGLLIQRDNRFRKHNRFSLTHFHVKIDWPIMEAAESLARELRYVSKSLYEQGERYAEILQQKLFEFYGWHHQAVGGRRSGALSAFQYLKNMSGLSTVYVSSAEAKSLTRYSEKGVARYGVIQFDKGLAKALIESCSLTEESFRQGYALGESEGFYDVILFVTYKHTEWGKPPEDGKLRILKPDYSWLAIDMEMILPMPHAVSFRPLPVKWVYRLEGDKRRV